MSAELALRNLPQEQDAKVAHVRAIKDRIATLAPDELLHLKIWAEAVAATARVQQAEELAYEAAETKIRAERRLGKLLLQRELLLEGLTLAMAESYRDLARIPENLFEEVVFDLLKRGQKLRSSNVYENALRRSLRRVEPGIFQGWDGTYYVSSPWGESRGFNTRITKVSRSLIEAQEELMRATGFKQSWASKSSRRFETLDRFHARARRLAQGLMILKSEYHHGEVKGLLEEAELYQAKSAELLFTAFKVASTKKAK